MEVKITLGAPQDAEKWSQNFSGGPPAKTSEFFFGPGGLQERSGIDFYSKKVMLKSLWIFNSSFLGPEGLRAVIWGHFGSCWPSF